MYNSNSYQTVIHIVVDSHHIIIYLAHQMQFAKVSECLFQASLGSWGGGKKLTIPPKLLPNCVQSLIGKLGFVASRN